MLELASEPSVARQQLDGLVVYLTTFGYIDGDFAPSEGAFIRETLRELVTRRLDSAAGAIAPELRQELLDGVTAELDDMLGRTLEEVTRLQSETVIEAEQRRTFVASKLKQRCYEIFHSFEPDMQEQLLAVADSLVMADGYAHPAELELREELRGLLRSSREVPVPAPGPERRVELVELRSMPDGVFDHPLFSEIEKDYSSDEVLRSRQLDSDRVLVRTALELLARKKQQGRGRLADASRVDDLAPGPAFLDQFVQVLTPRPGPGYDLTVVGDLHGCYTCLKAALLQSRFLEKLLAHRREPETSPEPKLVFLGDFLDRGQRSFEGVFRLVLQLFTSFPDNVFVLRGNHELFLEHGGRIVSAVSPAEGIAGLRPIATPDLLRAHMSLFNALPSTLICGRLVFAHGGVPRDATAAESLGTLAGLNDWPIRFQMMWSDPSVVDVIPRALQESTYRFGFGRLQSLGFLRRLGCHTLVRGHEHVETGFHRNFDEPDQLVVTVFSSGGSDNPDLPVESDFRRARPSALSVSTTGELDASSRICAWPVRYERFCDPALNGFLR